MGHPHAKRPAKTCLDPPNFKTFENVKNFNQISSQEHWIHHTFLRLITNYFSAVCSGFNYVEFSYFFSLMRLSWFNSTFFLLFQLLMCLFHFSHPIVSTKTLHFNAKKLYDEIWKWIKMFKNRKKHANFCNLIMLMLF